MSIALVLTNPFSANKSNKIGFLFVSCLLTGVAAFRFDIGWDYVSYYNILDNVILAGLIRFEPFSLALCLPAIWLDNPFFFFISTSCIIYPLTFYSFRKLSVSPALSLIIYLGLFYLVSCSIVRQALAVSICLYAYKYLQSSSFKKYCFCILLATLFHYSAAVSLIIYPIYRKGNFKFIVVLLFAVFLLKNVLFWILSQYGLYTDYLDKLNEIAGGGFTRFFNWFVFISFFLCIKKDKYDLQEKRLLSIVIVGLMCPFMFGTNLGERLGYYFILYYCYLIPILLQNKMYYKRCGYVFLFISYFLVTIYYTSNIPGQKSVYVPYKTIFQVTNVTFRE